MPYYKIFSMLRSEIPSGQPVIIEAVSLVSKLAALYHYGIHGLLIDSISRSTKAFIPPLSSFSNARMIVT